MGRLRARRGSCTTDTSFSFGRGVAWLAAVGLIGLSAGCSLKDPPAKKTAPDRGVESTGEESPTPDNAAGEGGQVGGVESPGTLTDPITIRPLPGRQKMLQLDPKQLRTIKPGPGMKIQKLPNTNGGPVQLHVPNAQREAVSPSAAAGESGAATGETGAAAGTTAPTDGGEAGRDGGTPAQPAEGAE